MNNIKSFLKSSSLVAILALLAACVRTDGSLTASWYLVYGANQPDVLSSENAAGNIATTDDSVNEPSNSVKPAIEDPGENIDNIYILIANQGLREKILSQVYLNVSKHGIETLDIENSLIENEQFLQPGGVLVLNSNIAGSGKSNQLDCRLPVNILIKSRKRGKTRSTKRWIRFDGTIPSDLPEGWVKDCRPK